MTSEEHQAYLAESYKNRKGTATHYADGKPKTVGKTKAQAKADAKQAWLNRHKDPNYKGTSHYTTPHLQAIEKKKAPDWAGDVHKARVRNQKFSSKHYTDKGYKEDYR